MNSNSWGKEKRWSHVRSVADAFIHYIIHMFFLFFTPDTYTAVNISRLSRLEKKNSQKAFTSEREGARFRLKKYIYIYNNNTMLTGSQPKMASLSLSVALLNATVITAHSHTFNVNIPCVSGVRGSSMFKRTVMHLWKNPSPSLSVFLSQLFPHYSSSQVNNF